MGMVLVARTQALEFVVMSGLLAEAWLAKNTNPEAAGFQNICKRSHTQPVTTASWLHGGA